MNFEDYKNDTYLNACALINCEGTNCWDDFEDFIDDALLSDSVTGNRRVFQRSTQGVLI